MGNMKVTVLKTGIPKLRDVKDLDNQINIDIDSLESLKRVFDAAVPQLGRELAKNGPHYYTKQAMSATSLAADASVVLSDYTELGYNGVRDSLAKNSGYEHQVWTVTDKCGNTKSFDWSDLYENNVEVELIVRISRKALSKDELAKAGVK